jgi:hypothetical protein
MMLRVMWLFPMELSDASFKDFVTWYQMPCELGLNASKIRLKPSRVLARIPLTNKKESADTRFGKFEVDEQVYRRKRDRS